jgi:hypothetical protein
MIQQHKGEGNPTFLPQSYTTLTTLAVVLDGRDYAREQAELDRIATLGFTTATRMPSGAPAFRHRYCFRSIRRTRLRV